MTGLKPKKSGLTVKYHPLKKEGTFDIESPINKTMLQADQKEEHKSDFKPFLWMSIILFLTFALLGLYGNSKTFILNTKNIAKAGYDSLIGGADLLSGQDFKEASKLFNKAELSFEEVDNDMRFLTGQANDYINTGMYLETAQKLIDSGMRVSKIGQHLANLLSDTKSIPNIFVKQNVDKINSSVKLTDFIQSQKKDLDIISAEVHSLENNLSDINISILPDSLSSQIIKAKIRVSKFIETLNEVEEDFRTILIMLGDNVPHRYLILFQNNHELRATGGFLGSYMLLDVNDGEITKAEIKDVYETDGQLTESIPAPPGINRVADRLYMRDANYSPDFPTSAKKVMWFLEHSRGPSVDTVIAMDQTVIEDMLAVIGPVVTKNFPFIINKDNFSDLLSYYVEAKLSDTQTPKQILIDLMPVLREKLLNTEKISEIANLIKNLIYGRHIQIYSNHNSIQELSERIGVDGRMLEAHSDVDYLSVITTAIGGNKSDAFIKTDLTHNTQIDNYGHITDQLIITKHHTWEENDFDYWKRLIGKYGTGRLNEQTLKFIQGEGDNIDYMRVYVPKGSTFEDAEGINADSIEISEDLDYTVFSFIFGPIPAGNSKTVKFNYKLPYNLNVSKPLDIYRFIIQKQAGSDNAFLTKTLHISDHLSIAETYPQISQESAFTLYPKYKTDLKQNKIFLSAITSSN